jgi:transcriptional regulator with XRE-family HTH domain
MAPSKQQKARTSARLRARLRQLREEAGLSQSELASRIGFARKSTVSAIENGHRDTTVPVLEDWARECGASLELVKDERDVVDLGSLSDRNRDLVANLMVVLPRLDPMLRLTLENQIQLWRTTIPAEEDTSIVSLNVIK